MNDKLQELNDKIEAWQLSVKRQIAPPNYFNKYIFRIGFLLIAVLLLYDFTLNNYSFTSYYVECPEDKIYCINPIHLCSAQPHKEESSSVGGFTVYTLNTFEYTCYDTKDDIPRNGCPDNICEQFYLRPGEKHGRKDALTQYGNVIVFALLGLAFAANHLYYKKYVEAK